MCIDKQKAEISIVSSGQLLYHALQLIYNPRHAFCVSIKSRQPGQADTSLPFRQTQARSFLLLVSGVVLPIESPVSFQ